MEAQDVINLALGYISETQASIVGALPSGTGEDNFEVLSAAQFLYWANEGQNRVTRFCIPIQDAATVLVSAPALGIATVPYTTVTSAAGRTLHRPSQVADQSGFPLRSANMGYLPDSYWYPARSSGAPQAWADNNSAMAFSPFTGEAQEMTVAGYFLPLPLTTAETALDPYIDDFSARTIAYYVAMQAAQKNADNSLIASRMGVLGNEFISSVKEIYARLIENDSTMSAFFPPVPDDAVVQIIKSMQPRT